MDSQTLTRSLGRCEGRSLDKGVRTRLVAAYNEAGLSTRSPSENGCLVLRPYTEELLAYTIAGIGLCATTASSNVTWPNTFACTYEKGF